MSISKNNRPYTTKEFFNIMVARLKEQGYMQDGTGYLIDQSEDEEYPITEYCFDVICEISPAGDSIIVSFYLSGDIGKSDLGDRYYIGSIIKMYSDNRETYAKVSEMAAAFIYEANHYVMDNSLEFRWKGFISVPAGKKAEEYSHEDYNLKALIARLRTNRKVVKGAVEHIDIYSLEDRKRVGII